MDIFVQLLYVVPFSRMDKMRTEKRLAKGKIHPTQRTVIGWLDDFQCCFCSLGWLILPLLQLSELTSPHLEFKTYIRSLCVTHINNTLAYLWPLWFLFQIRKQMKNKKERKKGESGEQTGSLDVIYCIVQNQCIQYSRKPSTPHGYHKQARMCGWAQSVWSKFIVLFCVLTNLVSGISIIEKGCV